MFQTAAVDGGQAPRTLTGGQKLLLGSTVMTDPTHGVLWHSTEEKRSETNALILVSLPCVCVTGAIYGGSWVLTPRLNLLVSQQGEPLVYLIASVCL